MTGLNWSWIALMSAVPPMAGALVALPFWRGGQTIFGSLVGAGVVFGAALGLIAHEYVVLDRLTQACLAAGTTCWPDPSAFTRFAIYACIALAEVCVLFAIGLRVDERMRRRRYAPEWR